MKKDTKKGVKKLALCSPCCTDCPQVYKEGNNIIITDDNDVAHAGVRKVILTAAQFQMLMEQGKQVVQ